MLNLSFKKYVSEVVATFSLIFCGTGAMVIDEITHGAVTHVGVAITWGLTVIALIYAFGDSSGAHMNPAVTITFAVNKNFPAQQVLPYMISQLIGAFAASELLHYLFPTSIFLGASLPRGAVMQSFILEIVLSFFLMTVILEVATGSREQGLLGGIAIGFVVLLEAMFAGPICGASMNPFRSLAPAVVSGHTEHLWVYLSAPVIGMLLAVAINKIIA